MGWQKRFEKAPVLIAPEGGEEILRTYLAPNKVLIGKKSDKCVGKMCVSFMGSNCLDNAFKTENIILLIVFYKHNFIILAIAYFVLDCI